MESIAAPRTARSIGENVATTCDTGGAPEGARPAQAMLRAPRALTATKRIESRGLIRLVMRGCNLTPELVGMKRLDLHGNVVAWFAPQDKNVLIVSRRGTHREASRHGYDRTRSPQARESTLYWPG